MIALVLAIVTLLPMTALAEPVIDSSAVQAQSTRTAPLTIGEVLARIELTHPLLRAMGAERSKARAKILKALGAWEPTAKSYFTDRTLYHVESHDGFRHSESTYGGI